MKYKAVIFDLDGTLYDNTKLPVYVVLHSILHLDLLAAERIAGRHLSGRFYGDRTSTYEEYYKRISRMTLRSEEKVREWYWEDYMPLQVTMLRKHFKAKKWVLPLLERLRAEGVRTACYSEYSFVKEKLIAIGVDPALFDVLFDAPSAGGCKPSRKSIEKVAELLGAAPCDILMVGDREDTDGVGADSAGMDFVLVPKADTETINLCI